ncbi:MAG: hypothetical protein JSV33_09445 [bacterium]|nr:MAG: hypothetical protein JSV33_09445 [bacterium]
MSDHEIEDLIGVNWFDGLLVRSEHLHHTDKRTSAMISDALDLKAKQPGIFYVDSKSIVASQLVEAIKLRVGESENEAEIYFNVLKPFKGITPDGGIIVAIPNDKAEMGIPSTDVVAKLYKRSEEYVPYLICVKQQMRDDLVMKKQFRHAEPIELAYPGLEVELITPDAFRSNCLVEYRQHVPVALLGVEGAKAEVDASYIPPVTSLAVVEYFETGMIDSMAALLRGLCDVTASHLAAGGKIFLSDSTGVELRMRYNLYQVLNAILLGKSGIIANIASLSPFRFLSELVYPIAKWFDQYYETVGERHSSLQSISKMSKGIQDFSFSDICSGTGELLKQSREFILQIRDSIKEIA